MIKCEFPLPYVVQVEWNSATTDDRELYVVVRLLGGQVLILRLAQLGYVEKIMPKYVKWKCFVPDEIYKDRCDEFFNTLREIYRMKPIHEGYENYEVK